MKVKALRVAAYLLIAHFLIASALGFAARGGPDYQRMAMTLAILIVAVSALFNPRRKGWLAVVAYALYVLAYQVLGLSLKRFRDCSGIDRYQVIWIKR